MEATVKIITLVAFAGLAVCSACLTCATFGVWLSDVFRRFKNASRLTQIVLLCAVAIGTSHGGGKPRWRISFSEGIKDDAQRGGSYVTNDTIHIVWERDTRGGIYIPETAAVYIDYRPSAATNEEWGVLAQSVVSDWGWDGTLADATNYDYSVWAYYIPPEPVHTNGVWVYKTLMDRNEKYPIPVRARIEVNRKAIATPKERRKDEQ